MYRLHRWMELHGTVMEQVLYEDRSAKAVYMPDVYILEAVYIGLYTDGLSLPKELCTSMHVHGWCNTSVSHLNKVWGRRGRYQLIFDYAWELNVKSLLRWSLGNIKFIIPWNLRRHNTWLWGNIPSTTIESYEKDSGMACKDCDRQPQSSTPFVYPAMLGLARGIFIVHPKISGASQPRRRSPLLYKLASRERRHTIAWTLPGALVSFVYSLFISVFITARGG